MAKKDKILSKLDITPGNQAFWVGQDIDPKGEEHIKRNELAEYNYYAGLLAGGLDPDVLGQFQPSGTTREERGAYAEQFAKNNPGFYVPESNYGDYIGEENVERFIDLKNKAEREYDYDTSGTQTAKEAFGARQYAMSTPRTFYTESPTGKRAYEYKYSPDRGAYQELTSLEVDKADPGFKAMTKFEKDFKPELAFGMDATQLANYKENAGSQIGGAGQVLGAAIDVIDDRKDGTKSVLGATAQGMASGAAAGAALGPVGSIVGAGVMGGISAIKTIGGNKEAEEANLLAEKKEYIRQATDDIQPTKNTQAPMAEFGVAGAQMTTPVEVEKDEVIMRKDSLGNYTLAADFKGGKRHDQGGEDYILQEGDIVFPGKKRSTVMNHLKNGNTAALETERMKLPKDLPEPGEQMKCGHSPKLQEGMDNDPGYKTIMGRRYKKQNQLIKGILDPEYSGNEDLTDVNKDFLGQTGSGFEDLWNPSSPPLTPEGEGNKQVTGPSRDSFGIKESEEKLKEGLRPKTQQEKGTNPTPVVSGVPTKGEDFDMSIEPWMTDTSSYGMGGPGERVPSVPTSDTLTSIPGFDMDRIPAPASNPNQEAKDEAQVKNMMRGGSTVSDILDFAPAAANIIRGMSTPEKVDRRFVTPDEIQYRDQSAQQRAEVDAAEKVEMENAARFAGGSAQVARAGKAAAAGRRFRRKAAIDSTEMQRADAISAQNVGIRNRAEAQNIELANQYDTMDAQNKAAVDAYFDQGIYDVGRIAKQKRRDTRMEKQQDILLENLRTGQFGADRAGSVSFLPGNDILPR